MSAQQIGDEDKDYYDPEDSLLWSLRSLLMARRCGQNPKALAWEGPREGGVAPHDAQASDPGGEDTREGRLIRPPPIR